MSMYRTLTVEAQLSDNKINASADVNDDIAVDVNVNDDIAVDAEFTHSISVNNVSDYELLNNKPHINSVALSGDKSFEDLGLEGISNLDLEHILN